MDTSPVPSTRIGRFLQYGSLATGLGLGALSEGFKRLTRREPLPTREALLLTPENTERMVQKLARMRGAVLKLGQLLSFQQDLTGTAAIPPELQTVLARVQNAANYMPAGQLECVMSRNLSGAPGVGNPQTWKQDLFASFEDYPIAAASIGQVHGAVLLRGYDSVAIKVQYPGVADSIDSDLNNLQMLLNLFAGAKGAAAAATKKHLSKIIATARTELKWECDYLREAQAMERFRELLADDPSFVVPRVHHEVSTARVLTMQRMRGIELTKLLASPSSPDAPVDPARTLSQDERDWLGTKILELVLKEIAVFKYMQTDPNWANFLYNRADGTIELLDFGAARGYTDEFSSQYVNMLRAAVAGDRPLVLDHSRTLGYVTGDEAPGVLATHVDMQTLLVAPFTKQAHDRAVAAGDPAGRYDFKGHGDVTRRIMADVGHAWGANAAYAPPEESFGIQRKLSGVYMLCSKLEARVPAYQMFNEIVGGAVL
ncbi:hypothetical protein DV452_004150 [Geotrichum candidum]|nr:hypothetical protein DV452_004150 [Geotrichum candidum]